MINQLVTSQRNDILNIGFRIGQTLALLYISHDSMSAPSIKLRSSYTRNSVCTDTHAGKLQTYRVRSQLNETSL